MKLLAEFSLFISRLIKIIGLIFSLLLSRAEKPEVRFRLFFERAGGAFVKLGQILALRFDLLPPNYTEELLSLLSRVPAVPFNEIEPVLISALKAKPSEFFSRFNPEPIASASISQVYRATLKTGEEVAVKVKRPGIDEIFATDFALASFLAGIMGILRLFNAVNFEEVVAEFIIWTKRELDFRFEAKNAEVLREHSKRHPNTIIPKIYHDISSSQVLVMEFMTGIQRVDQIIEKIEKNPNLRRDLLLNYRLDIEQMAYYFMIDGMRQYFIDGFFHADPHPANVFFAPDNRLGYFDFGIMGEVDSRRADLLNIIYGIAKHDLKTVSDSFLAFSKRSFNEEIEIFRKYRKADHARYERVLAKIEQIISDNFRAELEVMLAPWYYRDEKSNEPYEVSAAVIFSKLLLKAESYSVFIPREMAIFFRGLIIADMVALKLDPSFSMIKALNLFFHEYPLTKAEQIIVEKTHEKELEGDLVPITNLDYEQLMELKVVEKERLNLAAERLSELVLYYAENYEEIRKML